MTPDRWIGSRDRSWGIRPVGEARAARPRRPSPPFEGMWWLYVPDRLRRLRASCLIIQEEPDGFRPLNDCTRVWPDGRVEQLGWPRIRDPLRLRAPGHRPTASITCTTPDGTPVTIEVESLLPVPIHVGGGYGGDPDWAHGQWKGAGFTERVTYDMNDPAVAGRVPFGLIDNVGRAVWREEGKAPQEGWGLFEHGVLGRHDPVRLHRLVHPRTLMRRPHDRPRPRRVLHRRRLGRPGRHRRARGGLAALRAGRGAASPRGRPATSTPRWQPPAAPSTRARGPGWRRRSGSTSSRPSPGSTPGSWPRWPT